MELRYCEECGNAYKVELGRPFSVTDRFVCESCTQRGPGAKKGKDAKPGSARLSDVLEGDRLNLFSQQTIVLHKQKQEASTQKPKSSRLRLVKPGAPAADGTSAVEGQPAGSAASAPGGSVRMASSVPGYRGTAAAAATAATATTGAGGSVSPSKSARKILFRCLHCRSTLSIRPVERTSKLVCPQCSKDIYVTSSGRLFKTSPSAAVRKDQAGGSAIPPVEGSVRVAKGTGSTVQLRAQPAATGAAPAPARKPVPGSSRIQPLIPGGSVRLTKVHPGAPPSGQKPCSAFQEHRSRQDPEKTVFITEEPTEDLSQLASSGVMRDVAEKFATAQSGALSTPAEVSGSLETDDGDLLSSETEYVGVPAGSGESMSEPEASSTQRAAGAPKQAGLTQRVLKALFSP